MRADSAASLEAAGGLLYLAELAGDPDEARRLRGLAAAIAWYTAQRQAGTLRRGGLGEVIIFREGQR